MLWRSRWAALRVRRARGQGTEMTSCLTCRQRQRRSSRHRRNVSRAIAVQLLDLLFVLARVSVLGLYLSLTAGDEHHVLHRDERHVLSTARAP